MRKDIWRPAIVGAPIETVLARGGIDGLPLVWVPDPGSYRFLADPFGLWRDGRLHVFVEAYDYRRGIGHIEALTYDASLNCIGRAPVLREPWHLSYPFVFEADGDTWLLPEAHRSGRATLYRATEFPWGWEPAADLALPGPPIDATPFRHEDRWWLCYASAAPAAERTAALHVAFADALGGPWTPHPGNPVIRDARWARPGGTPIRNDDGTITLPVQDCSNTYGGAVRPLHITSLTPRHFEAAAGAPIGPAAACAPYLDGLHTLAGAGPVTLIDVKRRLLSPAILPVLARRALNLLPARGRDRG